MSIYYIPNWKQNTKPLCTAMKVPEVIERLELTKLSAKELSENRRERIWSVMPSVATSGDGLFEGLVSSGLSLGQRQSNGREPGMAIKEYQDTPTTTSQIGVSSPHLHTNSTNYLHVQHKPFRIPRNLLSYAYGASSLAFQQANHAIVISS